MTANQIAYQQLKEAERTNRINEAIKASGVREQQRANLANEQIKRDTLTETRRHNLTGDQLSRAKLLADTTYTAINMGRDFITGGLTSQGLLKTIFG